MRFKVNENVLDCAVTELVVAGWTGRDEAAIRHHVDELAALGVAPPSSVPLFYRAGAGLLTQAGHIQVLGPDSSGEAEPFLLTYQGKRYLGLASDHTDRKLETYSVAASKQACPKPVAPEVWLWDEVADHLDQIEITSRIEENGAWVDYQKGRLADIRPLEDLISGAGLEDMTKTDAAGMLCGTFAAIGGVRPAQRFEMQMHDPILGRHIHHAYTAEYLDVVA